MTDPKVEKQPPVPPFVQFCCAAIPQVFDDSLSYYEAVCAMWKYLDETVKVINNNALVTEDFIAKFDELKSYVEHYFDNLDVQEEINNKLDAMVEDGTLEQLLENLFTIYPVKENETGVVDTFYPYGDVYRYGAKCDGTTDDKDALNTAISNALLFNFPVKVHGLMYVTETINTHGVTIEGDLQPTKSGAVYPDGIGYDYPKNMNDGFNITFADYISTIPNGTAIVSDIANPILSTDYDKNFKLRNFGVYGWLRNNNQIGVEVETSGSASYYSGHHEFNNFSVFNTGSHGIHLYSLETTTLDHVNVELVNGAGIYVEGLSGVDTPVDYVTFKDCRFRYTRLHGVHMYNSARKNIKFEHCNFNFIGQYDFGSVNDQYGDRDLPDNNANIIYSVKIDGLNSVDSANQLRYLQLVNNYGEASIGFVYVTNINTIVGLTVTDNSFTKLASANIACYLKLSATYVYGTTITELTTNFITKFDVPNISELTASGFVTKQLFDVLPTNAYYKNANKNGYKAFDSIYGNTVYMKNNVMPAGNYSYFNSSSSSSQTVTVDIKPLVTGFLKSNLSTATGQSFALGLLSLSNGGNAGAAPVSDLIAITHHNDKYFVGFVTNNTSATADTDGVITITVPAYKIATVQIIQQIDTTVQN